MTSTDVRDDLVADLFGTPDPAPWPDPTTPRSAPLPDVPGLVGDYAAAVAAHYQVPQAFAFLVCLAAPSVASLGRFQVAAVPGWDEPVTVYVAAVLPPGERKSPTLRHVARPLRDLERRALELARPVVADAQDRREVARLALDRAIKGAAAGKASDTDVMEARADLDAVTVPTLPRLLADDITPEALAALLADHRALGVMEAEGGLFATLAGRYADGTPNLDAVNKSFSGEPFRVDRKGSAPAWCEDPHLTLALCVQPDVVAEVRQDRQLVGRGFPARFLYAVPESMLGRRLVGTAPTVPVALDDTWTRHLVALHDRCDALTERATLALAPAARDVFLAWCTDHEQHLGHPDHRLGGWAAKLPGQLLRVAALLTLADTPTATTVDTGHLHTAITLAPALTTHATLALRGGTGLPHGSARTLRWIHAQLSERPTHNPQNPGDPDVLGVLGGSYGGLTFSTRDAWQGLREQAWADTADRVRAALADLAAHGWVRRNTRSGRPGRPTETWTTHPDLDRHYAALTT